MANLLGSLVMIWTFLRLYKPEPLFGLFDAFARTLFFIWQVYFLILWRIAPVVWGFAFFELLFGALEYWGYFRLRKKHLLSK